MKPKLNVAFVLDRSSSMENIREQTVCWYNDQLEALREKQTDLDITVSLVTFGSDITEHNWAIPLKQVKNCSYGDFNPGGMTALYAGLGVTISKMLEVEADQKLIVLITDGGENSSHNHGWTQPKLVDIKSKCDKSWTFNIIGCESNTIFDLTSTLNIPTSNCMQFGAQGPTGPTGAVGPAGQDEWNSTMKNVRSKQRSAVSSYLCSVASGTEVNSFYESNNVLKVSNEV